MFPLNRGSILPKFQLSFVPSSNKLWASFFPSHFLYYTTESSTMNWRHDPPRKKYFSDIEILLRKNFNEFRYFHQNEFTKETVNKNLSKSGDNVESGTVENAEILRKKFEILKILKSVKFTNWRLNNAKVIPSSWVVIWAKYKDLKL